MQWIYLSPHLDDVALSCGGLVWQQAQEKIAVQVWSICAGDPPDQPVSSFAQSLHHRWQSEQAATEQRRQEDIQSCEFMGAHYRHFPVPDCIYRLGPPGSQEAGLPLYDSEESLWGEIHPAESHLLETLGEVLRAEIPEESQVVCPLTLGGHVDHRLTRRIAERLDQRLWYYADYPYAQTSGAELDQLRRSGWKMYPHPISEQALQAWISAVAAHRSQISTFWHQDSARRIPAEDAMRQALRQYCQDMGGIPLWQAP